MWEHYLTGHLLLPSDFDLVPQDYHSTHGMALFLHFYTPLFIFTISRSKLESLISLRSARASELGYSAYISSVRPLRTDWSEKCCKWIFYIKTQHALHFYLKCRCLDIITVNKTTVPDSSRYESVPYIDFLFYRQFWCCVVLCTHRSRWKAAISAVWRSKSVK